MKIKLGLKIVEILIVIGIIVLFIEYRFNNDGLVTKIDQLNENQLLREVQINELSSGISLDNIRRSKILKVKKIIQQRKDLPELTVSDYAEWIVDNTNNKMYVDEILLSALITQESNFHDSAVSMVEAKGLGQIMDLTAEDICLHLRIPYYTEITYDPKMNIIMSAWFLERLCVKYKDVRKALAYYNGGYRGAYRYELYYKSITDSTYVFSDHELTQISKLPEETRKYVEKVMKYNDEYRKEINKNNY